MTMTTIRTKGTGTVISTIHCAVFCRLKMQKKMRDHCASSASRSAQLTGPMPLSRVHTSAPSGPPILSTVPKKKSFAEAVVFPHGSGDWKL